MKRFVIFLALIPFISYSQNVGIGTNTPQSTLDIKGNQRLGGVNNFLTYDSATGRFTWTNSFLWATNPQYLVRHSASSEGLYYSNQQLEYRRSDGSVSFSTNWNTNQTYVRGNLAVGLTTPSARLHVLADAGDVLRIESPQPVLTMYNSGVHTAYLRSHAFGLDLGTPFGWPAPIRLMPADQEKLIVYPNGQVRIEGPVISGTDGLALSIGGYGDVQVDANGLAGGRFAVRENGNVGIGNPYPFEKLDVFGNIRANAYKMISPKTYYYAVDPSAFIGVQPGSIVRHNGGLYMDPASVETYLFAPVNLPHKAVVTRIYAFVNDSSPTVDLSFYFYGLNSAGSYTLQSAVINSSGSAGNATLQSPIMSTTIENGLASWGIHLTTTAKWPGSTIIMRAIIIEYSVAEL